MQRHERKLDKEAFDRFLVWLDPDKERAASLHESIRRRLQGFLSWRRGCDSPDECADETLERVVHKFCPENDSPAAKKPLPFILGIARRVHQEHLRDKQKRNDTRRELKRDAAETVKNPTIDPKKEKPGEERRFLAIHRCLRELPVSKREIFVRYHMGNGRKRILQRKTLARENGWEMDYLRLVIHRIKEQLRICANARMNHDYEQ